MCGRDKGGAAWSGDIGRHHGGLNWAVCIRLGLGLVAAG